MDPQTQKMWDIAKQVYQQLGSRFGVNQTPVHTHNNIDSPNLSPASLTNTKTLSAQPGYVLKGVTVTNIPQPVVVYPIPIMTSVPTGIAVEGTLVAYHGALAGLYLYMNATWLYIGPYRP